MSAKALDDLKTIVALMGSGMSFELDVAAFPRFFGNGQEGKDATGEFADENHCVILVKEDHGELSATILKAYAD